MEITIFEQFSVFDAGKQRNVDAIIERLPEVTNHVVSINFVNCLIDYPATSKLIDELLRQLSAKDGTKKLLIKSDLTIDNESLILSLLVWGSKFFDFTGLGRSASADEFRKIINSKLKEHAVAMEILLLNDDNSLFKQFIYE